MKTFPQAKTGHRNAALFPRISSSLPKFSRVIFLDAWNSPPGADSTGAWRKVSIEAPKGDEGLGSRFGMACVSFSRTIIIRYENGIDTHRCLLAGVVYASEKRQQETDR